ncbi:MAG TPA: hypothetical protein VFH31_21190 [Pyrinomonadaceae bacterium]|nr:hypothetical protein [Pyrinomonadaceae bacterium]
MKRRLQIEVVRYRRRVTFEDDDTKPVKGSAAIFDRSFNEITNEEARQPEDQVIEPENGISANAPLFGPRRSLRKLLRSYWKEMK